MKEEIFLNEDSSTSAKTHGEDQYRTGFIRWRATDNGFADWTLNGVRIKDGALEIDPSTASPGADPYVAGTYEGGNYYNGGLFFVGEATSPEIETGFNYKDAIASWNAYTPAGTWLEIQFRARYGERWSKWYILGIWASEESTVRRHSVKAQDDADGRVAADTFLSLNKAEETNKFQLKFRLFSVDGVLTPSLRNASVAFSTSVPKSAGASTGKPALWNTSLDVLQCSQMVYPDGGDVWCSPTSISMVLSYWDGYTGLREPRVRTSVENVFDWIYNGHGNWPFNTAYTGTLGYEGYIARFTSLERVEEFVTAGVPVIASIAWRKGDLTGADIDSTDGHLVVIVGFDAEGNPIVNDPAVPEDERARRTYLRSEFEPLWLRASGGTVYLIYPEGKPVPALP
ncbi:MAG TPA: peptidase C39 family protein [Anaerolineales bacterium]|nr:peptidase C39 family protein [Anaerolineales bacterium]